MYLKEISNPLRYNHPERNDNGDCDIVYQLILANNTEWLKKLQVREV